MRIPLAGGPAEAVMDVTGHPVILTGTDPTNSVGGYPSFRCPVHSGTCVLAESGENQIAFTAFDPVQGRKVELTKVAVDPDTASWDLSPDGTRVVISLFDYKAGDLQIVPLNGGAPQKMSAMPWTELVATAWAADGKSLFLASYSSRGTSIVRMPLTRRTQAYVQATQLGYFLARAVSRRSLPGFRSAQLQLQRLDNRRLPREIN